MGVVSCVLLHAVAAHADWTPLPAANVDAWSGACTGMRFVSATTGYAVDGSKLTPLVLKTTNGGASWSGASVALNNVGASGQTTSFVLDADTVFLANSALGTGGLDRIARTINGGASWTVSSVSFTGAAPAAVKLYAIHAISATAAWAGGETLSPSGTALFKSVDGTTWSQVSTTGLTEKVRTLHFFDAMNGVIGGVNDIFRTTDGGSSWTKVDTAVAPNRFAFVSPTTGFFFDNQPALHQTENSGQTWSVVPTSSPGCPMQLGSGAQFYAFADAQNGFVSCSGGGPSASKFRKTTTGGTSWTDETFPSGWPGGTNFGAGCVAYAGPGATLRLAGAYGAGEKRFLSEGIATAEPDAGAPPPDGGTGGENNSGGGATSNDGGPAAASTSSSGGAAPADDGGCDIGRSRLAGGSLGLMAISAVALVSRRRRGPHGGEAR